MSVTALEICNNALSLCGQGTHISSLSEESKEADLCSRLYQRAVERCIDKYDWSFCRKDEVITADYQLKDVASPPFHYTYKLPDDCLRVLSIHNTELDNWYARQIDGRQTLPFDFRNYKGQKVMVCDTEAPFVLQYQALVTDVALFSPTVIEAIEFVLAGYLCIDLINGTTGAQLGLNLEKQGYTLLREAWTLDSHIGAEVIQDRTVDEFMQARRGFRRDY